MLCTCIYGCVSDALVSLFLHNIVRVDATFFMGCNVNRRPMDHLCFTSTFDHNIDSKYSMVWPCNVWAMYVLDYKLIAKTSRHGRGVCDVSKTDTIPMTFWQRIIQFITRWIVVYSQLAPNVTFTVKQVFSSNVWYCAIAMQQSFCWCQTAILYGSLNVVPRTNISRIHHQPLPLSYHFH